VTYTAVPDVPEGTVFFLASSTAYRYRHEGTVIIAVG
jgi:hypothetical protein